MAFIVISAVYRLGYPGICPPLFRVVLIFGFPCLPCLMIVCISPVSLTVAASIPAFLRLFPPTLGFAPRSAPPILLDFFPPLPLIIRPRKFNLLCLPAIQIFHTLPISSCFVIHVPVKHNKYYRTWDLYMFCVLKKSLDFCPVGVYNFPIRFLGF